VSDNPNTPSAKTSPQQGIRRLFSTLLLLGLLAVLAFIVITRWNDIKKNFQQDDRAKREGRAIVEPAGDKAAEQEAAAKLSAFKDAKGRGKYLVISERPDPDKPEKRVTCINYKGAKIDDETLELTARLYRIGTVLAADTNIADDQLKYFSGLTALTSLVLANTPITDAGLTHLRPLANIETLYLANTKVSDRGLDDVGRLTTLKILDLSQTKVTDNGMEKLVPLTHLDHLLLRDTAITDAGLDQLARMKNLRRLTIQSQRPPPIVKVTPAGIERLKKAIPVITVD
jgi:Leucine-rich repeat (LRR) protein